MARTIGSNSLSSPDQNSTTSDGMNTDKYLVGGIPTPLKNMSSSVGMMTFPYIMEK